MFWCLFFQYPLLNFVFPALKQLYDTLFSSWQALDLLLTFQLILFFTSLKGLLFHVVIHEVVSLILLPGTLLMLILAGAAHTFLIPLILYLLKLGKLLSGNKLKVCLVSLLFPSFLWTSFS